MGRNIGLHLYLAAGSSRSHVSIENLVKPKLFPDIKCCCLNLDPHTRQTENSWQWNCQHVFPYLPSNSERFYIYLESFECFGDTYAKNKGRNWNWE